MKNAQFANLLKKYVDGHKINNTNATKKFIAEHAVKDVKATIPEPTDEIREYAKTFIKKGYKCSDVEFTNQMVKFADAVEAPVEVKSTQRYTGEY